MKKIILTVLTIAVGFSANAQNVNIPDANFKAALIANAEINTNEDDEISEEEAAAFTGTIDVHDMEIADLTGIEAFVSITNLQCYRNQLVVLDVSNNTALTELVCWDNRLNALDVSQLPTLVTLSCGLNAIRELDLSQNILLGELFCPENSLTELDVSNNLNLSIFYFHANRLTSIDVRLNTNLKTLGCGDNKLTSIDISNNTALTRFVCYSCELTELDVSKNIALDDLEFHNNNLTSIDLSNNLELKELRCDDNALTTLDLSNNGKLGRLTCSNNSLETLDVKLNWDLYYLNCMNNQLTELDLLSNVRLRDINCSGNQLKTLNLSNNARLRTLVASTNQLATLDLTSNDQLTSVKSTNNQLTTVDLRNGTNDLLEEVELKGNPDLLCVQVDDAGAFQMAFPNSTDTFSFTSGECTQVSSIVVAGANNATSILSQNGTLQMEAVLMPNDAIAQSVNWSVDDPSLASIDADGLLTSISEGTVKVIATAKDATAITGEATIELNFIITALGEKEYSSVISVYPNPTTKNWVMIEGLSIESTQAQILAMNGQVLQSEILTADHKISVANLKSGMYMLHIINSKINTTTKLVIE